MADLFVSYARADRARVAPLVAALEGEGWSVWWDPEISPGQEFDRLISEQLETARAVVVVWTPISVESRWVRGEAREGLDRGVLAPVRFEHAHLPIDMRVVHTTDLDDWNDDPEGPAFRQLVRALRTLMGESDGRPSLIPGARPKIGPIPQLPQRRWPWRWVVAGVGAAAVAAAAFGIWRFGQPVSGPAAITVDRVSAPAGDGAALEFADRLPGDLATMAAARPTSLKIVQPAAGSSAPAAVITVGGQARTVGDTVTATMNLSSTRDHSIVWSASFSRPLAKAVDLSNQAAIRLADVLTCALGGGEPAVGDIEVLKLFLTGCAGLNDSEDTVDTPRNMFRKVVARAPEFARAWALLAMDESLSEPTDLVGARVSDYQRTVEEDAAHALRLDPRQALAWTARGLSMLSLADWPRRRAYLEKALALQPDEPMALNDLGDAMAAIGRVQDALTAGRRAAASDPLSPEAAANLAFAEGMGGTVGESAATFAAAERRWPGDPFVSVMRVSMNARVGDAAAALKELDDPARSEALAPAQIQYWRLLCRARIDPARSAEAAAYMRAMAGKRELLSLAIQGLVGVGHVDDAFDLLESKVDVVRNRKDFTEVFFRPFMTRFLASPRFMPLAARAGLTDIWTKTGLWPDYCTAPGAPYDCKAEAAKAMAALANKS